MFIYGSITQSFNCLKEEDRANFTIQELISIFLGQILVEGLQR